jgi:hypothetical protein
MADRNGYIGRAPGDSSVIIARQTFSPTGVTTDFTFAAGYSVGYVDAFINGAKLIEGQDYVASNGSTVGLTSAAQNGDILELVAYKAFNVANITATGSLSVGGDLTVSGVTSSSGGFNIGIQSRGVDITTGPIKTLNFLGIGNTFAFNSSLKTVDITIQGGAGGTWSSYTAGIATSKSVGINTDNLDNSNLTGVGNSFQGIYISNGMIVVDNELNGNHYIGTNFNGLMAGPVTVNGTLSVDGNYIVV